MYNPFNNAGIFLISSLFDMIIFIVLLRLIMQWVQISFRNPLAQFVFKVTEPVLKPLRKISPKSRLFDIPLLVLLFVLEMLKLLLLVFIQVGSFPHLGGLLIWAFADILNAIINVYFYAILVIVIMSWLNPAVHSPIAEVLYKITEPLLMPAKRYIPPIGGLDLSPIAVLLCLQLIVILLVQPLAKIGMALALAG